MAVRPGLIDSVAAGRPKSRVNARKAIDKRMINRDLLTRGRSFDMRATPYPFGVARTLMFLTGNRPKVFLIET
jgi:hypothetical protein